MHGVRREADDAFRKGLNEPLKQGRGVSDYEMPNPRPAPLPDGAQPNHGGVNG